MKTIALVLYGAILAHDTGQFPNLTPAQRQWFQQGKIAACCSEADGKATDWEIRVDGYYVPVPWADHWIRVPDDALVLNQGNLTGQAIIWYQPGGAAIRCFIPGGGV